MSANSDTVFLRTFLLVLGALVAFTVIILIAANRIGGGVSEGQADDPMRRAAVLERIQPMGRVNIAGIPAEAKTQVVAAAVAAPRSGAEVYQAVCSACHIAGVAGAPKLDDKAAWEPRVAQGMDYLASSVINGKGAMPARGGQPSTTDEEIRAAIVYMLEETGLQVPGEMVATAEPVAPTEPAAAPVEAVTTAEPPTQPAAEVVEPAPPAAAAAPVETAQVAQPADVEADDPIAAIEEAATSYDEPEAILAKGQQVYKSACFACHDMGVAGSPKLGDIDAWAPRIAQGAEILLNHAINGYQGKLGYMPPKGGRMDLSDVDVAAAIAYMVSKSH